MKHKLLLKACLAIGIIVMAALIARVLCQKPSIESQKIEVASSKPPSAAKVVQPVDRATVQSSPFSTNQTPTVRGTLPFVLTSRVPFTKPLRLAAEALGATTVGMISRNALPVEVARETRARLSTDAHFETITEYLPSGKFLVALRSPAIRELAVRHVLQIVTGAMTQWALGRRLAREWVVV